MGMEFKRGVKTRKEQVDLDRKVGEYIYVADFSSKINLYFYTILLKSDKCILSKSA